MVHELKSDQLSQIHGPHATTGHESGINEQIHLYSPFSIQHQFNNPQSNKGFMDWNKIISERVILRLRECRNFNIQMKPEILMAPNPAQGRS